MTAIRHYAISLLVVWATLLTPMAFALPATLRAGANHHLGDDSFIALFGRAPVAADSEALRMRVHLQYVRQQLGARRATTPELDARRAQLLGYLDEYIAKGTTPVNTYVPWRNPVFIDAHGNICAVGYLIERSVGRALAERIATRHRLDYLEDIAAAMPGVAEWVTTSGFTLEELASIQPGYPGPDVMHLAGWLPLKQTDMQRMGRPHPADGPYRDNEGFTGRFTKGQMEGEWRQTQNGAVVGKGTFQAGAGHWKSLRADGSLLAEGPFSASHPDGTWRFYHPGGRLAATGYLRAGRRDGAWRFYHDAPGLPLLATGEFIRGEARGTWKHYATNGALIATASGREGSGFILDTTPGRDGVRRAVFQGMPAVPFRVDGFFLAGDRLYVTNEGDMIDAKGNHLERQSGIWLAHPCRRSTAYLNAARTGNVKVLYQQIFSAPRGEDKPTGCDATGIPVAAARAAHYERMLASRDHVHTPIPEFNVDPAWTKAEAARTSGDDWQTPPEQRPSTGNPKDMVTYLANHMTWFIEFPHVDRTFARVYASLPGYMPGAEN